LSSICCAGDWRQRAGRRRLKQSRLLAGNNTGTAGGTEVVTEGFQSKAIVPLCRRTAGRGRGFSYCTAVRIEADRGCQSRRGEPKPRGGGSRPDPIRRGVWEGEKICAGLLRAARPGFSAIRDSFEEICRRHHDFAVGACVGLRARRRSARLRALNGPSRDRNYFARSTAGDGTGAGQLS